MDQTVKAGGPRDVDFHEKLGGLGEVTVGSVAATSYYWGPLVDQIMKGLHFYSALGGAALVTHGLWRMFRGRRG